MDLSIEREIVIDAPAEVVWRTITEPDQISQWFADRVKLDLRPGGDGSLEFELAAQGDPFVAGLVVEAVEPPHRFAFRWSHPEGETPGATNSTLVELVLVAETAERTRLRVVESGLDVVDWDDDRKSAFAEDHRNGWARHVGRLGELLGTPAG